MRHFNTGGNKFDDATVRQFNDALSAGDFILTHNLVSIGPSCENRRKRCEKLVSSFLRSGGELPLPDLWRTEELSAQVILPITD